MVDKHVTCVKMQVRFGVAKLVYYVLYRICAIFCLVVFCGTSKKIEKVVRAFILWLMSWNGHIIVL